MKTLSQEIMALDFRRVGKNYALAAVVVLVVCVGLGAFLLWPQLVEAWALLGLVGNLAAVALFFAARSLLRTQCAGCGGWSAKASGYCRHCGTGLGDSCPSCGQSVAAKDIYCVRCGTPLGHENG